MSLSNSEFLDSLRNLFASTQTKRSVFLTYKRHTYVAPDAQGDVTMEDSPSITEGSEKTYSTLIRATDGSKTKFSTLVAPSNLSSLHSSLSSIFKSSMTSLRKKSKEKKDKKGGGVVKVIGPRRGKGRDKRQRLLKARLRALGKGKVKKSLAVE